MQIFPIKNFNVKTCFIQFLWFFRLKCWFKGHIISRIHLSLHNAYKLMCFDRNINGNRDDKFFGWDYWSLHWPKRLNLISFLTSFQRFLAMTIFSGESDLGPVSYLNHDWNKPHEECKTISQPFKRLGDNCPHWFVLSMNLNDSHDSDCESLLF